MTLHRSASSEPPARSAVSPPVNAGPRLDRLPIGPFHRRVLWLVGLGMFFDSFDNTLSGSVLAALLSSGWSTLPLNSLFMSVTFVGLTIGAATAGLMSDHFGRRFAYQFNLALFGGMALLSTLAPSMEWLIATRFVMGIGMGAEYVMCYGLITEFLPPAHRGRYIGLLGLFAGAGVFLTSLLSTVLVPTLGWRAMFLLGGLGALWVWWLRRRLPESPRWLERMHRTREAEEVLRQIEQEAGMTAPLPAAPLPTVATQPRAAPRAPEPFAVPISVLFSRPVIRRTLIASLLNVVALFGSYSVTGWMPTFFVSQGMSVTKSLGFNAAMMAGYFCGPLLCVFAADRMGRRGGIVTFGLLCAVFAAVYPFLASPAAIIGCGFLLVAGVAVFLNLGLGGTPELFPTEYRFRGGGFAQMIGRAGLIVSPFVVLSLFNTYGIGGVIGAISGMYLVVAILMSVIGVETSRRSLEELEPGEGQPAAGVVPHSPRQA